MAGAAVSRSWRWVWAAWAVLLLVGLAVGLQAFVADLATAERKAASDTVAQAHTAAEQLRWVVGGSKIVLRAVVQLVDGEGGWAAALAEPDRRADIARLVASLPHERDVWIVDRAGQVQFAAAMAALPKLDLSNRPFFKGPQTGEAEFISPVLRGRITGKLVFIVSHRLERGGAFDGIATVELDADYFAQAYAALGLPEGAEIWILKPDGSLVMRYPTTRPMEGVTATGSPAFLEQIAGQAEGSFEGPGLIGGEARLNAFQAVAELPLVVYLSVPKAATVWSWGRRSLLADAMVVGVILLLALAVGAAILMAQRREAARDKLEAALGRQSLLFREMHHRMKNNLQLVASLIRIQFRGSAEQHRQRVANILHQVELVMAAHQQLSDSGQPSRIDCAAYLDTICRSLPSESWEAEVEVDCPSFEISLAQAVPLGLVVNELVTNAFKHGLRARPEGKVTVTCRRAAPDLFEVVVADTGPGFSAEMQAGLGTRLLDAMVQQLGGAIRRAPGPGAQVTITVPLAREDGKPAPARG
jgi:two-component sensor histidine kinase